MAVMGAEYPDLVPGIFAKYDRNEVTDTMLRQKLLDIAGGIYRGHPNEKGGWVKINYSLFDLAKRHLGVTLSKDTWRMFYRHFRDVPLEQWAAHALTVKELYRPDLERLLAKQAENPRTFEDKEALAHVKGMIASDPSDVVRYALDDASTTMGVFLSQEAHLSYLDDQYRQARKAFWLHLASAWGLRTNGPGVERLREETETARDEVKGRLMDAGLVRKDGSRDTKTATAYMLDTCVRLGMSVRRTDGGEGKTDEQLRADLAGVSLDGDACEATGDALLEDYATYSTLGTLLSKDVPALSLGTTWPIHTRFDLAETGRTTSSKPNVQNWGKKGGARECFTPRPGYVYAVADVDQLELRTLAQVCLVKLKHHRSRLAEVLNAGIDPHTDFACAATGMAYEEGIRLKEANDAAFDDTRQAFKFTNFALPGGVGPAKMVVIARGQGIDLGRGQGPDAELARARDLKAAWFVQWPEMREYFRFIESLKNPETGLFDLVQLYTNRHRGGARYTACANSWFQGLGADGAGEAGWLIAQACYVDRNSPLFGSRVVNHSHDDFVAETLDGPNAHDAATELGRLMVRGFGRYTPDVSQKVKPYLTRVWGKKAKAVYSGGRLVPWGNT